MTAILGSQRCHLGSGTRTGRSARIHALGLLGDVLMSSADGDRLGIETGDAVRVTSPNGVVTRRARIDRGMKAGTYWYKVIANNGLASSEPSESANIQIR